MLRDTSSDEGSDEGSDEVDIKGTSDEESIDEGIEHDDYGRKKDKAARARKYHDVIRDIQATRDSEVDEQREKAKAKRATRAVLEDSENDPPRKAEAKVTKKTQPAASREPLACLNANASAMNSRATTAANKQKKKMEASGFAL
eukprot:jgi/Mesvir1/14996/Mv14655-RA.1